MRQRIAKGLGSSFGIKCPLHKKRLLCVHFIQGGAGYEGFCSAELDGHPVQLSYQAAFAQRQSMSRIERAVPELLHRFRFWYCWFRYGHDSTYAYTK